MAEPVHTTTTATSSGDADLSRYIRILRKRIWVIGAVVAIGVTAVVVYTMRRPKIYEASASIVIDPQPPAVFGQKWEDVIQIGSASYWQNKEYYNTQVDIIESHSLAQMTVVKNRLHENPQIVGEVDNDIRTTDELINIASDALAGAISASQNRDSHVVQIRLKHTDPDLAVELANKHVETFIGYVRSLRTDGSGKVSQFLATELDHAQARLKATEEALLKFRKDNDILSMSLADKQSILAKDITSYSTALSDSRVRRMQLAALRARVTQLSTEEILESPVFALAANMTTTSTSSTVGLLKEEYYRERQRLLELAEELGPKHPGYLSQKKKVDDVYAALGTEARVIMRELDERNRALQDSEHELEGELERLKKEAFELAPKSLEYTRLVRQQQSDEANYNLVLERLRTSELSGRNTEINVRPHSIARDARLVYPRMRVNVVLAFMLSLLVGATLAFLLEFMDRTLKTAEDVDQALGAPLLGVVPIIDDLNGQDPEVMQKRDLYVFNNPQSRVAECCRSIRTNILFSSPDRPMRTITVSSARPREGKTTLSIYLGTTMAQSGQRILLIDTDLRRPRLHASLGVSKTRGLTNLIMGESSIEDVVKTTDIPNLFLLPCGPLPPNPAEMLLTQRFRDVLDQLATRFDRLIIDSPPLLSVTDAVILARLSDGVVLITQAGKTVVEDARVAARQLRDVDGRILGVILNELDMSDRQLGYYYYQYGYGSDAQQPEEKAST